MNVSTPDPSARSAAQARAAAERGLNPADRTALTRARRAARWVGLYLPLAVTVLSVVLITSWMPRIPDPAATHWSGSGGPDGFGPAWSYLVLTAGLGFGLGALFWLCIILGGRGTALPVWSPFQRFMAAFAAGTIILLQFVMVTSVYIQLDLEDAADAPGIGWLMALGFGLWVLISVLAWFAQPNVRIMPETAAGSVPLQLAASERAVWVRLVRLAMPFLVVITGVIVVLGAVSVLMFVIGEPIAGWICFGVTAFMLVLMATTASFWVRVDDSGLEVRSFVGWPVLRVPARDIERVEVADINPFAEFGGWGVRWVPGRTGVVLRAGTGIVVTRHDGRIFAVTVDDAETGGALLSSAAVRTSSAR